MKNLKKAAMLTLFSAGMFGSAYAQHPVVTVDNYFNNEFKKGAAGEMEPFHYLWNDKAISGYSIWGDDFVKHGATLKTMKTAPTLSDLKGTDVYIIVDPDTKKETADPHYIEAQHIKAISEWVKQGGVLVIMANDSANVELPHTNKLAEVFGMHFSDETGNHVIGNNIEMGTVMVPANHTIFKTAKKVYLKDIAPIILSGPAKAQLKNGNVVVVATAKYGKGTVLAVGDPWFYNEYTNGHLPASLNYDNDKAADDVAAWLIKQVPGK
jgi:hypothetical protein